MQCIGVAAHLGIADQLVEGTQPVEVLAESINVDAQSLYRLLRALASSGIFAETEPRHFTIDSSSITFRFTRRP
jgi:DNA-binding IclR family transcriptional regulator